MTLVVGNPSSLPPSPPPPTFFLPFFPQQAFIKALLSARPYSRHRCLEKHLDELEGIIPEEEVEEQRVLEARTEEMDGVLGVIARDLVSKDALTSPKGHTLCAALPLALVWLVTCF